MCNSVARKLKMSFASCSDFWKVAIAVSPNSGGSEGQRIVVVADVLRTAKNSLARAVFW
jgi:hypothetical protein